MSNLFGMDCIGCGGDIFVRAENYYTEGETETCQECGVVSYITIDDSGDGAIAYANSDERAEDRGQPRCDGSDCGDGRGAVKEFHGSPCRWDCKRAAGTIGAQSNPEPSDASATSGDRT